MLRYIQSFLYQLQKGNAQPHVYKSDVKKVKIPIIPIEIQDKVIEDVKKIENETGRTTEYVDLELKKIVEKYLL